MRLPMGQRPDLSWMNFRIYNGHSLIWFPGDSVVKNPPPVQESTLSAGDPGLIPTLGRSPREGNGNPL